MSSVDIGLPKIISSLTEHHNSYDFISPAKYVEKHKGKNVIVTGGGRGLGKAIATAFAAAGANVAIVGRTLKSLKSTAIEIQEKHGVKVLTVPGDVRDPATARTTVQKCKEEFGGVDILVNNAGVARFGTLANEDMDLWWRVFEINVKAPALFIHEVLPLLVAKGQGQIYNIVSDSGTGGIPFCTSYCGAKSAMIRVGQVLSWEVAKQGIEVFNLHPGTVFTDFQYGEGVANMAELDSNPQMKMMFEYGKEFLKDTPELIADTLVALAAHEETKALSGRYINANRDIGELFEAIKAGKLTPEVGILGLKEI